MSEAERDNSLFSTSQLSPEEMPAEPTDRQAFVLKSSTISPDKPRPTYVMNEEAQSIKAFFMAGKFRQATGYLIDRTGGNDGKYLAQISLVFSLFKTKDFANSKKIAYKILEQFETQTITFK